MDEIIEENKNLKEQLNKIIEENNQLKELIKNKIKPKDKTTQQIISEMISDKVQKEVHSNWGMNSRTVLKRKIMDNLKWELHVRYANEFTSEHIEKANEYIRNYEIEEYYKYPIGTF